jgi:hypothetical protein
MEGDECVHHSSHADEREQAGADLAHLVTEVEQANRQTTQNDGEIQPREKCPLVCEEDFGFDPCGKGDSFACADYRFCEPWRVTTEGGGKGQWDRLDSPWAKKASLKYLNFTYLVQIEGEVGSTFWWWYVSFSN